MWNVKDSESWHALYVITGHEEKVKQALEMTLEDEIQFTIPKRELRERKAGKWHMVKRKLFPGYILLKGKITEEEYYKIKKVPILSKMLIDDDGPLKIDEKELEMLNILINNKDGNIGISTVYKENEKVKVVDGPLMGLEGNIQSIDARKGRAKVAIEFLGETRIVQLGVEFVDKI
ncbi:MAG: antiterminator LoaP [Clostridia bacterium]|nr:antiterminator LoaP [Clostridia bacterium]